jgi:hypothetical protein
MKTMFNLEQSIADWRQQMLAAGIQSPVPLEELEGHLREDVEQLVRSGLDERQAFGMALKNVGQTPELKCEFNKIGGPMKMEKVMKLAGFVCVAVALFCPLFIFVSVFLDLSVSLMPKMLAVAVYAMTVVAIVLSWKYNHRLLPAIHNQLLRRTVGIVCYAACLLWIRFGIFHFPPGGAHPWSLLLPLFIFGLEWVVMAILGGIGHGLEKAASKQTEPVVLLAGQS